MGGLCIVLSLTLKLIIPRLLGNAVDTLRAAETAEAPEAGSAAADALHTVGGLALWILGLAAAVALIRTASRLLVLGASRKAVHDVRNRLFDHLLTLAPSFYGRHPIGHLMSRCVNDMQNVQGLMGPVFMYLTEVGILYAICLGFMLSIDPVLTAAGLLPFPFFLYFARKHAARIQYGSRAAQEGLARVSARVDESLSGQLVIKTLTLEDFDRERFEKECDDYRKLNLQVTWARATLMPMMVLLGTLSTVAVLIVGGPRVLAKDMSLGDFVSMLFYFQFMAGPTAAMAFVISSLQRGAAALGRVREVLEWPATLTDPEAPVENPVPRGDLEVRDLSVVHPPAREQPHLSGTLPETPAGENGGNGHGGARTVLDRVSFRVPAGGTLGIVGHTGAGKTTLAAALARQLEVPAGTIFLDGVDVTAMRLADVRRRVGYVPQEAFLFSRSLAENLALGRPEASEAQIRAAAERSRFANDLPQLSDGMETLLGERGVNLSGGQRQRAALARVLLTEPRVLILDDTLSAVDTQTAQEIRDELAPWTRERTTVIVDHRISNLMHADHILVLEEGRIVEEGSHARLLELGGRYAALYERQQSRASLEADLDAPPEEDSR